VTIAMLVQNVTRQTMKRTQAAKPWRFMLFGGAGAGKTTLLRALEDNDPASARKSQMIDYSGWGIDTPGEYSEMGHYRRVLLTTSFDAQLVVVVQDATDERMIFPPHYFLMFPQPTIGVVTKMDLPRADLQRSCRLLAAAGVTREIFSVSALSGDGISALRDFLLSQNI
jgi:ethanolamine utilization protein EutP